MDVGGTPEPENLPTDMAMDGESDVIVRQLERSLPRWEGFADVGWSNDIPEVCGHRATPPFNLQFDFRFSRNDTCLLCKPFQGIKTPGRLLPKAAYSLS